jgi:hypothetical protein
MSHRTLIWILLVLLASTAGFGQAELTGRISGRVVDEEDRALADVRVTFVSPALQRERVVVTAQNGTFLAALLPVGAYSVSFTSPGYAPVEVSFRLGVGQTFPLDIILKRGEQLVEEVTVYGKVSRLETTTLGESFDYRDTVESLPIQDRTIEGVATYSPNISFGPTAGTISISGAPSFDNIVLLDGAEVSDPYYGDVWDLYFEDAIEELQVMSSGVSARYGRFQGGVMNAITKSGGNTFDGTLRVEFDKQSWNSQSPFGEQQSDELNKLYQGTLGGYILKDRLWFFAGYRYVPTRENAGTTVFTGESFLTQEEQDRWMLKARASVAQNHVIEAGRFEYDRTLTSADFFGDCADLLCAQSGMREDPRYTDTLAYQGVLSSNAFLDVQATRKRVAIKGGGDPTLGSTWWWLFEDITFNNAWFDSTDEDKRDGDTFGVNLTQAFATGGWGSHTLEYGAQYVKSTTGGENRQSPTDWLLIALNPSFAEPGPGGDFANPVFTLEGFGDLRWRALPFPGTPEASLKNTALYVQDAWTLGKWRFDGGLRWDRMDGEGPLAQQTADFRTLAPRLGATHNIDSNWQLQATFGRYYGRMNDNFTNSAIGVASAPRTLDLYIGPDLVGVTRAEIEAALRNDDDWFTLEVTSPDPPTTFLADDLKSSYADDVTLTVKRALPGNSGVVTISYTDRQYKNLIDDFKGGFGTVETPNGTVDATIIANASQAQRDYSAVTATWDYRPAARWNVGGNYTWARAEGNYVGEQLGSPATGSVIGDYVNSRPDNAAVPYGYLPSDIRHRFQAWGNYRVGLDKLGSLVLGGVFRYRSGLPWSFTANVPFGDSPEYLGDAGNTYVHFFDGRGSQRFNGIWSLDASARWQFPIVRGFDGWVKVSIENLSDNDTLVSFSTAGTAVTNSAGQHVWAPTGTCGPDDAPSRDCSGFGRIRGPGDYQMPRNYLLTLGLSF